MTICPEPSRLGEILRFGSLGLTVIEVWGRSETTGTATTNEPARYRPATVGMPAAGMEVRLAPDGEVEVRGPLVLRGYLRADGTIEAATDAHGWLATGDVGQLDEDGFLVITDRKQELIITSSGRNVAPTRIEGLLRTHPLVGFAAVIGDRRPYLTALLTLDEDAAPAWAQAPGLDVLSIPELARHPRVQAAIAGAVDQANAVLSRPEQIKRYLGVPGSWTPESGAVTPKLSLRRRVISELHATDIDALYQ